MSSELIIHWSWISSSSIIFREKVHCSVVCSTVFLANPVRRYERCVAPQETKAETQFTLHLTARKNAAGNLGTFGFYSQAEKIELEWFR